MTTNEDRAAFETYIDSCIESEVGLEQALVKDGFGDYCVPWVASKWSAWCAALQSQQAAAEPVAETWIVVKEHVWKHDDGGRPTLAYLLPSEFGRTTYPSFEAASAFIKAGNWPLGWVAMELYTTPPDTQAVLQRALVALKEVSKMYGLLWDTTDGRGFLSPESCDRYDAAHSVCSDVIAEIESMGVK